jgi:tungstate transport system substrate-binding protein
MIIIGAVVTILIISGTIVYSQYFFKRRLLVSTTTSLYDTGLLNEIEKAFETKYQIDVQFISVGTGIAIQQAQNGDVDATLVHSPSLEKTFLEQGYGVCRKIIAYNFFTIVGPQSDPAGIGGSNATQALKKIAAYGETQTSWVWVSRGDNSGTHTKEQSLWKGAGYNYTLISQKPWYASAGAGMGDTLLKAEEFSAYTLSDIGTYLKYSKDGRISLVAILSEEYSLLNVYSVIAANQTLHQQSNFEGAITFINFLISDECQQLIEDYGKSDYGQSGRLFHGAIQPLKQNPTSQIAQWIDKYAFFDSPEGRSECPQQYRDGHPELYD